MLCWTRSFDLHDIVVRILGPWEIWWRDDESVSVYQNDDLESNQFLAVSFPHIHFPAGSTIPYDITLEQLNVYLTFS